MKNIETERVSCAFCDSSSFKVIMNFGEMALAGGFLTEDQFSAEKKYPLKLCFCDDCYAVQLSTIIDPSILFKNYFYFSSAIPSLREHFTDYAGDITERFLTPSSASVVEIGCNDGVLLRPLADLGIKNVLGVDPAKNVIGLINDPRIQVYNQFFDNDTVDKITEQYGNVDMVIANNVYAHIPEINQVTQCIFDVLSDDGVFIFEVHSLDKIIESFQYDMIYHEHMYYHSLLSLENHFERFNMVIFDLKTIPIHAGSVRYYVCKKGSKQSKNISPRVLSVRKQERDAGYDKFETFASYARDISERRDRLVSLIGSIKKKGKTIAGYGASGRANTIIQYSDINYNDIDYIIDDAPAKRDLFTPGSHIPIRSIRELELQPPDYLLLFAWGYYNEITAKCRSYLEAGGCVILPLPDVRTIYQPSKGDVSE